MDPAPAPTPNPNHTVSGDGEKPSQMNGHGEKAGQIRDACRRRDPAALRALATSDGGLVSDELRKLAWPLLLGCDGQHSAEKLEESETKDWKELPKHGDEDQVQLDVDRSFIYYPTDQTPKEISRRKSELSSLIREVLRRQPYLHYFQGYHDICQVFLLVLSPPQRAPCVSRLSALRIRDYMLPTLTPSLAQLRLIPSLIAAVNPALHAHLPLTRPFFAIPGILTMYAHDVQSYGDIARVFDALLAREAVFSVYMFAASVLARADELFAIPADEPDVLHSVLAKLPHPLDLEGLIARTGELLEAHPPEALRAWRGISSASALKTARRPGMAEEQSLRDGKRFFDVQVRELRDAERRDRIRATLWKYRRPARTVGVTILVGVLAYWMRRSGGYAGLVETFWGLAGSVGWR